MDTSAKGAGAVDARESVSCLHFSKASSPGNGDSLWHRRYTKAAEKYQSMPVSPELMDALAEGLGEWASILPQVDVDRFGRHKKANSWGLGAELAKIWKVEIILDMEGDRHLADRLRAMAMHLHKTAQNLDLCYPKVSCDEEAAERRLVLTCRVVATELADLLVRMKKHMFGVECDPRGQQYAHPDYRFERQPARHVPAKKRAPRAAGIEALRLELIEHIKSAKDHAYTAIEMGCEPQLLPRPSKSRLGQSIGLARHVVSRCFADPTAQELRLLWQMAGDLDSIMRFGR